MTLSLLHWNIWCHEKPANVLKLLQGVKPDIACLQELTQNYPRTDYIDVPKYLATSLGYNYHFVSASSKPKNRGLAHQGNGIFTKFPIITKSHTFVQRPSTQTNDYAKEGRVTVITDIRVGESHLTVATTHLSYTHRFQETKAKLTEENHLLTSIKPYPNNFILTGDFNVDEHSQLIHQLEKNFTNVGPDYSHKTWTTKPFDYNGFHEENLHWRLDHIFATKDIKVISSQILSTPFSDHLPIFITVDL